MMSEKIAVVGHVVIDSQPLTVPPQEAVARKLVEGNLFLRVPNDTGQLIDPLSELGPLPNAAGRPSVWNMYLGAGLLLDAHLRRAGHQTRLFNTIDLDDPAAIAALTTYDPDAVVLGTTFVLSPQQFRKTAGLLRRMLPEAFIVAGGQHVFTALLSMTAVQRRDYFRTSDLDVFVNDAQGEAALLKIFDVRRKGRDLDAVPNLLWRDSDGAVHETVRLPEENAVGDLCPDFEGVAPGAAVHLRTARSCAFKCAFCTYPSVAGDLAVMAVETALDLVRRAVDKRVGALIFTDDTFNVPPERFEELLDRMIAEGLELPWYSFLRCQYLDRGMVTKMRRTGCRGVFLGVESGSDRILKNMKKGAVRNYYADGIGWLRDEGIRTFGAFILGFPGETVETVRETRRFLETCDLDYYFLQSFYYLHHAPIHKRAARFGLTGQGPLWTHDTMTWREARRHLYDLFLTVDGPVHLNPDLNMWEYAYLRNCGMGDDAFRAYRISANARTAEMMRAYGLVESGALRHAV